MKKYAHSSHSISAIIPAYNEGPRIEAVLRVLTTYPYFQEIIVIDDGSTDTTGSIVQNFPVTYLKNQANEGKGAAMERAVNHATGDIIFFCDADVQGLTHEIITEVLTPVLSHKKEMSIAMRHHYSLEHIPWLIHFIFWLGGERALTKELWQQIPVYYKFQFRIESALNFYARYYGRGLTYKLYPTLRQVTKDKKRGRLRGNWQRLRFMGQILLVEARLRIAFLSSLERKTLRRSASRVDSP